MGDWWWLLYDYKALLMTVVRFDRTLVRPDRTVDVKYVLYRLTRTGRATVDHCCSQSPKSQGANHICSSYFIITKWAILQHRDMQNTKLTVWKYKMRINHYTKNKPNFQYYHILHQTVHTGLWIEKYHLIDMHWIPTRVISGYKFSTELFPNVLHISIETTIYLWNRLHPLDD